MSSSLPFSDEYPFSADELILKEACASAQRDRRGPRRPLREWRAALQAAVTAVSPALVDMAAVRAVDLGRAVSRLRPPPSWRRGLPPSVGGDWDDVWPISPGPGRRASPWGRLGRTPQAVRAGAVPAGDPAGAFFVAVDGPVLFVCARVGAADLLTHGGLLRIWVAQDLPDTVLSGAEGLRADHMIEHPVLNDRPYPIVRAFRERDWTVVEVATGLVPFAMPWPQLAQEAVAAGKAA